MPSGLTNNLAKQIAQQIVEGTKDSKKTPVENWEFIVQKIFDGLKNESIIVVDQLEQISVTGVTLISPPTGGPVTGDISVPSMVSLKGKIT